MNTTTEAQDRLGLPAEAWLPCTAVQPPDAEKMILDGDWPTAEAFLAEQSPLEILRIYLALLPAVRERYDALGIPQEVFLDGLRDITLWSQEHRKRCGTLGLDAWPWVAKTLRLEVFRLGRLQFEPAHAEAALQCSFAAFPEGTPLLNIHIPAGAPLRENEVLESLRRAQPFFRRYLGFDAELLHCHSWLLSPALRELLPPESGIVRFQSLFEVYATQQSRQAEERVFGCVADDPKDYPQTTLLQRRMKAYLQEGHTVGAGLGILLPIVAELPEKIQNPKENIE